MEKKDCIDEENAKFWNNLCGSQLAEFLGIKDSSPESLRKFDDWYFEFYPYLNEYIPFKKMAGKKILEVGLGYGTVSQKIAESGAFYSGLDIASGPVAMVNQRMKQNGYPETAQQGSILEAPFNDESFDYVVAIGCFHHTGDLQRALDETWRVLKPGGEAVIMVYYAYSYRRWIWWFKETFGYFLKTTFGMSKGGDYSASGRAAYDTNSSGEAAPETVYESRSSLKKMTSKYSSFKARTENIGSEGVLYRCKRSALNKFIGPFFGLDIYFRLKK